VLWRCRTFGSLVWPPIACSRSSDYPAAVSRRRSRVQGRSVALHEGPVDDEEAVAVHASRSTCRVLMVPSLVMLRLISLFVKLSGPGELGLKEQDRLVTSIKEKLPKLQLDSWDSEGDFCP
jgi:hypothetical protein